MKYFNEPKTYNSLLDWAVHNLKGWNPNFNHLRLNCNGLVDWTRGDCYLYRGVWCPQEIGDRKSLSSNECIQMIVPQEVTPQSINWDEWEHARLKYEIEQSVKQQEEKNMSKKLSRNMKEKDLVNINVDVTLEEFLFLRLILGKQCIGESLFNELDQQLKNIGIDVYFWDICPSLEEQPVFNSEDVKEEITKFINKNFKLQNPTEHEILMQKIAEHEKSLTELKEQAKKISDKQEK